MEKSAQLEQYRWEGLHKKLWWAAPLAALSMNACGSSGEDSLIRDGGESAGGGSGVFEPVDSSTDLVFTHTRGVYDSPFDLGVSRDERGTIAYTLDGSDPRSSDSAVILPLPVQIPIDPEDTTGRYVAPAVILRSYCPEQGNAPEMVSTRTYPMAQNARWGDSHPDRTDNPRTKNGDWLPAVEQVDADFIGQRTEILTTQLRTAGLFAE